MIQIDVKMPNSCGECPFMDENHGDYPFCIALRQDRGYNFDVYQKKFPNCPLKPVEKEDKTELEKRKDVCRALFNRCIALTRGQMCFFCGLRDICEKEKSV